MIKIFLSLLFLLSQHYSWASLTQVDSSCACLQNNLPDPHEVPQKFNFGKYKGLCVDSCRFRAISILQPDLQKLNLAKEIEISNFLHLEEYYKAKIPVLALTQAFVGLEEFQPHVFHVVLKFDVEAGGPAIDLQHQKDPSNKNVQQTRSFVVSAEGVPPKDIPYGLVESYFENYLLAVRVVSIEEETRWVTKMKNKITYKKLNLTPSQVQKMAIKALELSHTSQLQSIYKLFSNNCATVAFEAIDSSLKPEHTTKDFFDYLDRGLSVKAPVGSLRYLFKNNLIDTF
jgi:hypothetical protein